MWRTADRADLAGPWTSPVFLPAQSHRFCNLLEGYKAQFWRGGVGIFAVHSLMARRFFKRWWTKIVPESVERSTYVLFASLALILLYWQWRPITAPVWMVTNAAGATALMAVFWLGWATVLLSTFMISHFELWGLTQVWMNLRNQKPTPMQFRTPFLYGFVRHPIYLGFILAFWGT